MPDRFAHSTTNGDVSAGARKKHDLICAPNSAITACANLTGYQLARCGNVSGCPRQISRMRFPMNEMGGVKDLPVSNHGFIDARQYSIHAIKAGLDITPIKRLVLPLPYGWVRRSTRHSTYFCRTMPCVLPCRPRISITYLSCFPLRFRLVN